MLDRAVLRFLPIAVLLAAPRIACAQSGPGAERRATATVVVSVADATNGAPVADATVRLPSLGREARTDWLGEARLAGVPAGVQTVEVRRLGYAAATMRLDVAGDTVGAVFVLEPSSAEMDTVRVVAPGVPPRLQEFETRRARGVGRFLTQEVLEREKEPRLHFALAAQLPGLMVMPDATRLGRYLLKSRRANLVTSLKKSPSGATCSVDVYLDGVYTDEIDFLTPTMLSGVEHYPMSAAPPQYRRPTGSCHVVLLWSRF